MFEPRTGSFATEHFLSDAGSSSDSNYQTITGSHLTLTPIFTGAYPSGTPWAAPSGWDVTNGFDTTGEVTGNFIIHDSACHGMKTGGAWYIASTGQSGYLDIEATSPTGYWYTGLDEFTLELETYLESGPTTGTWYTTGYSTGAPGIYISNNTYKEYIEVLDRGFRCYYSDIYVSSDQSINKFRLAGDPSGFAFMLEDGNGVYVPWTQSGSTDETGKIQIGASALAPFTVSGKLWIDDFNLVTGKTITTNNIDAWTFPTGEYTWTTNTWEPRSDIKVFRMAEVGYKDGFTGQTEIDVIGYKTGAAYTGSYTITPSGRSGPQRSTFSLSDLPYGCTGILSQIKQSGVSGGYPPLVDYLTIYGDTSDSFLYLQPNWKMTNTAQEVRATIHASKFKAWSPYYDTYDEVIAFPTGITGAFTGSGSFTDYSLNSRSINISGNAEPTSSLESYYGLRNFTKDGQHFNNADLTDPISVTYDSATSDAEGEATIYTGVKPLLTPDSSGACIGNIINLQMSGNATEAGYGIEFEVTGQNSDMLFNIWLHARSGDWLSLWATGDGCNYIHSVDASKYRTPRKVSFTSSGNGATNIYFGVGMSGDADLNLDIYGAYAHSITTGRIETETYSGYSSQTGSAGTYYPYRGCTTLGGRFSVHELPTSEKLLLGKGDTKIYITPSGKVKAEAPVVAWTWADDATEPPTLNYEDKGTKYLTGDITLEKSTYIGLVHQASCFYGYSEFSFSGQTGINNFAKTNKAVLVIGDEVKDYVDLADDYTDYTGNVAPYISMFAEDDSALTIGSQVLCSFDLVRHRRSPSAGAEEAWIKDSRRVAPRGYSSHLPSVGASGVKSTIAQGPNPELNAAHIWCLAEDDGPVGFDKGFAGSHLIFSGDYTYTNYLDYNYTNFPTGSYATAKYSSSFQRLFARTGDLTSGESFASGVIVVGGYFSGRSGTILDLDSTVYIGVNPDGFYVTGSTRGLTEVSTQEGWNSFVAQLSLTGNNNDVKVWLTSGVLHSGVVNGSIDYNSDSRFYIGGPAGDINLSSVCVSLPHSGRFPIDLDAFLDISGDKSGAYGRYIDNGSIESSVEWSNAYEGLFVVDTEDPGYRNIGVAMCGAEDLELPFTKGFELYPDKMFLEKTGYAYEYPTGGMGDIGRNTSPFRILSHVPHNAVNIARCNIQDLELFETVGVIDKSHEFSENLIPSYYDSEIISKSKTLFLTGEDTSDARGLNPNLYSGGVDITYYDQVDSEDDQISSVISTDLNSPATMFYVYRLSDAPIYPYIAGTYEHDQVTGDYTKYWHNFELIKSSIKLETQNGEEISSEDFPWDILVTPYSGGGIESMNTDGVNYDIYGYELSGFYTGYLLPNHAYNVFVVSEKPTLDNQNSIFIKYPAIELPNSGFIPEKEEVYKPIQIARPHTKTGDPWPGSYTIKKVGWGPGGPYNDPSKYDLTIHGIYSGYAQKF